MLVGDCVEGFDASRWMVSPVGRAADEHSGNVSKSWNAECVARISKCWNKRMSGDAGVDR